MVDRLCIVVLHAPFVDDITCMGAQGITAEQSEKNVNQSVEANSKFPL